jgi:hypothetical protein
LLPIYIIDRKIVSNIRIRNNQVLANSEKA